MKNANQDGRLSARPILNRHFLFGLLAAFVAACPALPAIAQDANLELNPDSVPTNTVIATVPLGGSPGSIVVNKKDTFVYVVTASNVISEIDTSTNAVVATWSAGTNAEGLAITPDGKQLYVTNITSPGGVTILDASTGAVLKTIPITTGEPLFPQISPNGKFAYVPSLVRAGHQPGTLPSLILPPKKSRRRSLPGLPPMMSRLIAVGASHMSPIQRTQVSSLSTPQI